MKLQHLTIGDRFEYEGRIFVKTGPVTAASEDGGQQMIPRYAILRPAPAVETVPPTSAPVKPEHAAIRLAFENFYRTAERLTVPDNRAELAAARDSFLAKLG